MNFESLKFKLWFGDSKAINEKCKPLVLFHGSWSEFDTFNVPLHGAYFTNDIRVAKTYGEVIKVYLSIQQPLIMDFEGESDMGEIYNIEDEVSFAKAENFDGLIVYNSFDGESFLDQFIVFNPSQIKIISRLRRD
jgi:hypothetical protein